VRKLTRFQRATVCKRGLKLGVLRPAPSLKLLRSPDFQRGQGRKDAPEFISYSEWECEAAIEAYRNSQAHQEIVRHARALKGAKAEVKLYDVVQ
jgi:hypothetical protein